MTVVQQKVERDWKEILRDVLEKNVKDPFKGYIGEYLEFIDRLYNVWWNSDPKLKGDYAYHMALLTANSNKTNVIKAKINSFYAYLVYKGYVSAYRLMKDKYVAGGESIYTWLRMYRRLLSS